MSAPMINIVEISKIYRAGECEIRALDNVSLKVEKGESVAIVGQSGAGKSTLMNIIGCLDIPSHGRYILDGQEVSRLSDDALSLIRNEKIGFVFQGFNLIPGMSALENVELPLLYRGLPRDERRALAMQALDRVGLLRRRHHLPGELSGGQQQRAAIARAVAARPPVILADEPTGNLDSQSGAEVMHLLRELESDGKTVILITHDADAAQLAGRIIHIHDGRVAQDRQTAM